MTKECNEPDRCESCGYQILSPDADICPNCDVDLGKGGSVAFVHRTVLDKRPINSFKLRLTACDSPNGERLAALPEPWTKLERLAQYLEDDRTQPYGEQPDSRCDLQNSLDMLTAAALEMAGNDDPRCSVVNNFLRALGKNLAVYVSTLRELERHVRQTAPQFPSSFPQHTLAESIGLVRDGLRAVREDVEAPNSDSLDDLPRWEVNIQPGKLKHAFHRSVVIQAPDPLTARMVALNVARERWPGEDFKAISAIPHLDEAELS